LFPENEHAQALLAEWGLKLDSDMVNLTARVLDPETLIFGDDVFYKGTVQADWAGATARNKVLTAVSCTALSPHQ